MFAEDLSIFFDTTDGFAVNATITIGGVPKTIPVIYESPVNGAKGDELFYGLYYTNVKPIAMSDVEEAIPTALVRTSDITGIAINNPIVIESVNYFVVGLHTDGTGVHVLTLSLSQV